MGVRGAVKYPRLGDSMSPKRVVQPGSPSGIPLRRLLQPVFPLSLRDSAQQWTRRSQLKQAEYSLLDCVGLNPSKPSSPFKVKSLDVPVQVLPNSVRARGFRKSSALPFYMNELEVKNENADPALLEKHVVLVHGYGASKGYFYQNFKPIASNHTLHALDWLGYGLSSRPMPKIPKFADRTDGVSYGESWFLTPFESWRKERGIEKFTFVAHSLGAYLACAYARMFPERVEKLILVSPASVNRTSVSIPGETLYPEDQRAEMLSPITALPPKTPPWFNWMWENHWSPFSLVRNTGIWGPKLTSGWTYRRFASLPSQDLQALQDYSYRMFNAPGSGEYLLNYFLAAGGVGRWPLAERVHDIKCPSLWLYGENDWMDINGGKEAVKRLRQYGQEASALSLPKSGHHLYLDNERDFNSKVLDFLGS